MEETKNFELPSPFEKLSTKFIMEAFRQQREAESEAPVVEAAPHEPPGSHREGVPGSIQEICGTEVQSEAGPHAMIGEPPPIEIELEDMRETATFKSLELTDGKKYFRIGEVSEIIGVEAYVLRYWENEFSMIKPIKSKSGQRVYARKDVETLHYIRHLLHVENFSIKGAKKKLTERRRPVVQNDSFAVERENRIKIMVGQLKELIQFAKADPGVG